MYLTEKQAKTVKWISYVIQILLIIGIVVLSSVCKRSASKIKEKDKTIVELKQKISALEDNIYKLGAEEVLTVNCTINLKNTNVMGVSNINSNNIAKEICQMTRKELYDSIYGPKREIDDRLTPYLLDTCEDGQIIRYRKTWND